MSRSERSKMRPFGELASFAEARRLLQELASPLEESESAALVSAVGRCLATDLIAETDVPNTDRAAMDGFALRSADAAAGSEFLVVSRVAAGDAASGPVPEGSCVEIATGGVMPPGADAVVPVEKTRSLDGRIRVDTEIVRGQHVSSRGEDISSGSVVLREGTVLRPSSVAALAALGIAEVTVCRRPRVALISTGDEVVPLGSGALAAGQVWDSNAIALQALFTSAGATVERSPIIRDDRTALEQVLSDTDADLFVTIGGTSVGRRDLVADVVHSLGDVVLHGVAAKPGKPLLLARINGRPLVGLPGFPTSCLTMGYQAALPMVCRIGRAPLPVQERRAKLAVDVRSPAGKTHFLPVRLAGDEVEPTFTFSSSVTSMASSDGWIEIAPEITSVAAGAEVVVRLYSPGQPG
jgi:molybdenum cofactor synthesis domain-containing protein